ncbi:MAG: transglutaminase-like cysteine peptidase [Desulfobacteraceae bacterium]|nr:transglutaminase-like cysteine peptidase [Desulfobacteraceae bacterium]
MHHGFKKCLVALAIFFCAEVFLGYFYGCTWTGENSPSLTLNLPVIEIRDKFIPYEEFCRRNPGECKISEQSIIELTTKTKNLILEVNTAVNFEIRFVLDKIQYNKEEFWTYPISGMGDCEDFALEKRFRLTKLGIPIGALRIAIVNNKKTLTSHALLLIETTQGTYAMDRFTNQIFLWYQLPYNFEARERPDGRWERFDQCIWTFY